MWLMPQMRIREAAHYLGVSDDTVRRWVEQGVLAATADSAGRKVVDGYEVARVAREHAAPVPPPGGVASSARNRFVGLVTTCGSTTSWPRSSCSAGRSGSSR